MDVKAVTKYVRMPASKAHDLARAIQGLPVDEALKIVSFSERKAAFQIAKTLKSAIANAVNNFELSADDLVVREAKIDGGPGLRRYWPRSRGMARPIIRRTSHVRIVLTDGKKNVE